MKKLLYHFSALALILSLTVPASAEVAVQSVRNSLTTTNDPARCSQFVAAADKITAEGYYENDEVKNFEVTGTGFFSYGIDFQPKTDGSYKAVFEGVPTANEAYIQITLASGVMMNYLIRYEYGWYFPGNGVDELNKNAVENYVDMPPDVTALYISGALDKDTTASALLKIKSLAEEATAGLGSDYDKAKAITAWAADNIYYDYDARDSDVSLETIALAKVLETRKTVCAGYANLTAAMLQAVGIKSLTVIGNAFSLSDYDNVKTGSRHHEWTAFWYGEQDRWVNMDSGWDSGNTFVNGKFEEKVIARKYFDITHFAFSQNHRAEKAEYRDYFGSLDYLENLAATEPELTEPEPLAETDEGAPVITPPAVIDSGDDDNIITEEPSVSNVLLYVIIGVLLIAVAIMAVVYIKILKK